MKRNNHKGLSCWDYATRCIYMVTLVTSPRRPVFGVCREWGIERTATAKAVYDAWMDIPRRFPAVRLMVYSIMPDHFHGLLFITEPGVCTLDEVVCAFAEDAEARAGRPLWEDAYHDVVCLARGQRRRMTTYIMANPRRLWIRENNPSLFRRTLGFRHPRLFSLGGDVEQSRELWDLATGEEVKKPRKANFTQCAFSAEANECAFIKGWRRGDDGAWLADMPGGEAIVRTASEWTAIGNPFLLDAPMIVSVRISRFTPPQEFAAVKEKAVAKAVRGAVLAGAWINAFERQVRDEALAQGGAVISLLAEAIDPYFKPHGRDMELCAQGKLLLISPFAPPQKGAIVREHRGKPHFEWLNAAARSLADFAIGWARK